MKKSGIKVKFLITSIVLLVITIIGCSDGHNSSPGHDNNQSVEEHGHGHE